MSNISITAYSVYVKGLFMQNYIYFGKDDSVAKNIIIEHESVVHIPNISGARNLEELKIWEDTISIHVSLNADYISKYMTKLTSIELLKIRITGNICRLAVPNLNRLTLNRISAADQLYNLLEALTTASKKLQILNIFKYKCSSESISYIPETICNLTELEYLIISRSGLRGSIGDLSSLLKLKYLSLSSNNLEGEIPNSIGRLSNLKDINLSFNYLEGEIPSSIGRLSNLVDVNLSNNRLSGSIPESMKYLNNLETLELDNNRLSGPVPNDVINNLPKLWSVDISCNSDLEGEINITSKYEPLSIYVEYTNTYTTAEYKQYLHTV